MSVTKSVFGETSKGERVDSFLIENNNGMNRENLYVAECYANKGSTMKRIRARAQGRAYRIEKRQCHITVVLDER